MDHRFIFLILKRRRIILIGKIILIKLIKNNILLGYINFFFFLEIIPVGIMYDLLNFKI